MKTVIYKGKTAAIGRFGTVDQGAHLQLTEAEFAGVKDDPQFELISRRKPARDIQPIGTRFYDLRLIEWDSRRLIHILEAEGKTTLKHIVMAMNSLGCDLIVTEHDNTPIIVDAIVAEARALKWEQYDREKRRALGAAEAPIEVESEEESEEEESEDEKDETEVEAIDYESLSLAALRELCKERELPTTGNKHVIVGRLTEYDAANAESEEEETEEEETESEENESEGTEQEESEDQSEQDDADQSDEA